MIACYITFFLKHSLKQYYLLISKSNIKRFYTSTKNIINNSSSQKQPQEQIIIFFLFIRFINQVMEEESVAQQSELSKRLATIGEYLTNVYEIGTKGDDQYFFKEWTGDAIPIQLDSLYQLIIQTSYLIYASHCEKISMIIHNKIMIDEREQKYKQPIKLYLKYEIDSNSNPKNSKQASIDIIKFLLESFTKFNTQHETNNLIPVFQRQFGYLIKQITFKTDKEYFICLQESQMFRKNAILLKLKNSMIMNLIKSKPQYIAKFHQKKEEEKILVNKYNEFRKNKQLEKTAEAQKNIEKLIQDFFKDSNSLNNNQSSTTVANTIRFQQELDNKDDSKQLKFKIKFTEKDYSFSEGIRKITGKSLSKQQDKVEYKKSEFDFLIIYSSQKNLISAKLITDHQLTIESSDLLLFNCNNLIFDASNISLEVHEKPTTNQSAQKSRYLVFKGTTGFTTKEPILQKLLILIDTVVVTYKVIEPEITKSVNTGKDYSILQDTHKKVNHYINVFQKCARYVYNHKQ